MYHYASPPPRWSAYDYAPPPSPGHYAYYNTSPYTTPTASPRMKRHTHRASYSASKDGPSWYSSTGHYPFHAYDSVPEYMATPRKHEHVSGAYGASHPKSRSWQKSRHFSTPDRNPLHSHAPFTGAPRWQSRPVSDDESDDAFEPVDYDSYVPRGARTGYQSFEPRTSHHDGPRDFRRSRPTTDPFFSSHQVPVYDEPDMPRRSRARRASTSARTPQKPAPATHVKTPPKATEDDAARAGIAPGYSVKNWDPTEAPIVLLGSVFDANSLGKWIYDWTVFHHGATAPMSDVAGDLWLLLIKLAGKVKRADEIVPLIRSREAREMVEDFLESGERLWSRFKKLLKACEQFMWKAAKRESGKGSISMGRNSGCEFVDSIFGRDRELENTEKLMNSIRLWNMRFDANCEDILRRPTSA